MLRFLSVKNCEFFYILLATELCWGNPGILVFEDGVEGNIAVLLCGDGV